MLRFGFMKNLRKEARMEKINGIIKDNKVYIPEHVFGQDCDECALDRANCRAICTGFGVDATFRHSPELTERLKTPKKK